MNIHSPQLKSTNPFLQDENNEKDFSELNQAISNVIENQLDDAQDQDQEEEAKEEEDKDAESTAKYTSHFLREKQLFEKEKMFYSPDMKRTDTSRVILSPPILYSKFGTPNMHQRSLWQGNGSNVQNVNMTPNMNTYNKQTSYIGMNNLCFSPIHSYQYGHSPSLYANGNMNVNGPFSAYYTPSNNNPLPSQNAYGGNYFSLAYSNQQNEEQQMLKSSNKKKKKNKNKNNSNKNSNNNNANPIPKSNNNNTGKSYISQSPNLKSLFANGKNGQCIKFVPNYVSNPLKGEEQNQISLDSIIMGLDKRTTLMIKNIPNKYTIASFLEEINIDFNSKYDIFYLPIDYGNKCNLGFSFINFVDAMHIIDFYETYRGKKWKRFNSEKICDLVYAKIQGKKELIAHFEKGKVLLFDSEDKRPLILQTPSTLPPVTLPSRLVNSLMMAYPFAVYHPISSDKVVIDSFISY